MYRRPLYVSLIGAFLICHGGVAIFYALRGLFEDDASSFDKFVDQTGLPNIFFASMGLVVAMVNFVCGIKVMDGANWSRWVYAVACIGFLVFDIYFFPDHAVMLWLANISRAVAVVCFFLPEANEFFLSESGWK